MAKITKAEMPALAEQIVNCLGGKENVARINHCATRLRVNPVDMEKVDKDGLKRLHGVIGIDSSKAELQIIVGAIIEDLYLEVEKITGNGGGAVADDVPFWKKRPSEIFSNFLLLMAGCLSPVIPALIASGLLATVLTIMTLVLHVDASTSSTYSILYNLSQTVFYFMPVLVAYTSAKKFGTEPVLAMVLACFLLYPDWVAGADGSFTHYFGLPVLRATYNGAVIQIILSVFVMSLLDKWLKKVIPEAARHFVKPFALLLLMSIITLTVTGPLGGLLTNYIYAFVEAVRSVAPRAGVPVIVLLNTGNNMRIADIAEGGAHEVDGICYIGCPNDYQTIGIANVLTGKVNATGALASAFVRDHQSIPAVQNVGGDYFADYEIVRRKDEPRYPGKEIGNIGTGSFGGADTYNGGMYIVEAEGIYVGY